MSSSVFIYKLNVREKEICAGGQRNNAASVHLQWNEPEHIVSFFDRLKEDSEKADLFYECQSWIM